jgi:hypothetical protein
MNLGSGSKDASTEIKGKVTVVGSEIGPYFFLSKLT